MDSLIESGQLKEILGVVVAILSVLMPVAIVFIVLHFRHRKSIETLATVRYLADKGLPVPAELLPNMGRAPSERQQERSALISALSFVGAGIGLMIFFYVWEAMRFMWGVGALFAIVGLGQLLGIWLTRDKTSNDADRGAA